MKFALSFFAALAFGLVMFAADPPKTAKPVKPPAVTLPAPKATAPCPPGGCPIVGRHVTVHRESHVSGSHAAVAAGQLNGLFARVAAFLRGLAHRSTVAVQTAIMERPRPLHDRPHVLQRVVVRVRHHCR